MIGLLVNSILQEIGGSSVDISTSSSFNRLRSYASLLVFHLIDESVVCVAYSLYTVCFDNDFILSCMTLCTTSNLNIGNVQCRTGLYFIVSLFLLLSSNWMLYSCGNNSFILCFGLEISVFDSFKFNNMEQIWWIRSYLSFLSHISSIFDSHIVSLNRFRLFIIIVLPLLLLHLTFLVPLLYVCQTTL